MRSRTALSLFLLLAVSASGRATPFGIVGEANLAESAIAEIVVEDVESAPAGLPALDHLVKVEQVLQGSVPGTSLIVRVPAAQSSPALRPGGRAVLALAPARDGSFRLLQVVREGPGGPPAIPERPDRADPADWSLGPRTPREPEAGWSAAEKIVTGIFEGNGFVSTLAALNLEGIGGKVTVILRDAEGELVGDPAALLLGPRSLRVQPLIRMFPGMVSRRGPFTIELVSNGIHFAASAILLEIESEDEIFIPASAMEVAGTATSGEMFFPRVVHSHGPFDTLLTSRLIAFNPAEDGRLLTLEFWERGQDNMAPRTAYRYVEPGRSLRVDDVLPDLFGQEEAIGALRITWSGPAGPAPRVVTLTFAGTAGGQGKRFGTLVEAATGAGAIRTRGAVAGAGQTPTSRSSAGLVNLSPASTEVRLMLKDAAGDLLATTWLSLKPRQHLERNMAGLFPGIGNGEGWVLETEVVAGGPVLAYLAHIDAGGDIFYLPADAR